MLLLAVIPQPHYLRGMDYTSRSGVAGALPAPVRIWLLLIAALVFVMTLVGGATRLTGSGLSITEWRPVTGALPPLNGADWDALFALYKKVPQFELMNPGMSLGEFQFIFWWEWGHRQLGRFIGLAYLGGFLWFLLKRQISGLNALVLFAMGLLLGMQGLVGWIMVASGLEPGMTAVAPAKLALHLTLACAFFASLIWMAGGVRPSPAGLSASVPPGQKIFAAALLVLVFVQLALGGLVAGLKAGLVYNTWPLIGGAVVPALEKLFFHSPWPVNFLDNHLLVQFNHRLGAYALIALGVLHAFWIRRAMPGTKFAASAANLLVAFVVQAAFGITALLLHVPLWAGLLHQGLGILVLFSAVCHLRRLTA